MNRRLIELLPAGEDGGLHAWMRPRVAVILLLSALIFVIDTFTELASAVAVLYALVLMVAGDGLPRRGVMAVAAACVALTVVSYSLNHGLQLEPSALLRFLFSLAAVSVTAVLTLRNLAARQIHRAQARLLDVTADAIVLRDMANQVLFWNRGAEALYGWPGAQILGRDHHALLGSRFPAPMEAVREALLRDGCWEGLLEQQRRTGETVVVSSRWQLQRDRKGRPAAILETNTDVTAREAAAAALAASEERYRTIFETLPVGIWEHDFRPVRQALEALRADGVTDMHRYLAEHPDFVAETRRMVRVTNVNATALRMLGVPSKEMFFSHLSDFLPETDQSFARCLIAIDEGHPAFVSEATLRSAQGGEVDIIVALNFPPGGKGLDRIQGSVLDVTERKRMETALERMRAELDRTTRVATMGELSAAIAHEVNQPLSAIRAYADAARRWLSRDPPEMQEARTAIEDVLTAAHHGGEVVRRVRRLLAKAEPEHMLIDLAALIRDAMHLIRRDILESGTALQLNLAPGVMLRGDRVLLQQLLINLATNALQAMQATPPGQRRIVITSRVIGGEAEIAVRDTGPGFAAECEQRAFDAFFTTRQDGMGLGLSVGRSTVLAHEGRIGIGQPAGAGALILVHLPLAVQEPA
ncbi:PAS domain-containing sensor histidine kinase [Belnapia rosea]|uniref:histidine kinase n=1 Tax=Belnapia rosea TaxID=938405 RepID=A0A1G6QU78_9PROT|nr:PAS domain S-box protein [Belnapia rosea]SDC95454.1 PAS domain S-box-containing protein [Belnapia rosea]